MYLRSCNFIQDITKSYTWVSFEWPVRIAGELFVVVARVICNIYVNIFLQGWFSPGQVFVLDEYCARYGVRGCYRHLCYLSDLLDRAENQHMIDPTLIHYSFAFCASHVHGNR